MKKLLALVFILFFFSSFSQHCGTWRWAVKTLTDPEGIHILTKDVKFTSITDLATETAPRKLSTGKNFEGRLEGEDELVRVNALIVKYKKEPDQDYHIVLQDPYSEYTIVSEIPDPNCDNLSEYPELQERYRTLRSWLDSKLKITTRMKVADPAIPVKIEGVAFWDAPHGASGASDQGREIHPITDIISIDGSIAAGFSSPSTFELTDVSNREDAVLNASTTKLASATSAKELLYLILLGAILGMAGQVIRFIAGLKKSTRDSPGDGTTRSLTSGLDSKQMLLGLLIALIVGSMAGVLASINLAGKPIDNSIIVAFLAAGYAGTDLIEGFIIK